MTAMGFKPIATEYTQNPTAQTYPAVRVLKVFSKNPADVSGSHHQALASIKGKWAFPQSSQNTLFLVTCLPCYFYCPIQSFEQSVQAVYIPETNDCYENAESYSARINRVQRNAFLTYGVKDCIFFFITRV